MKTDLEKAIDLYSEALKVYPSECVQEIAICHANRGACYMKLVIMLINDNDVDLKVLVFRNSIKMLWMIAPKVRVIGHH